MKSRLAESNPPELEEPIKHLKLNTFSEEIDDMEYFYFMANKRNNSGTLYNLRFFLVMDNAHIGYAKECDASVKLPFRNRNKIPKLKASVKIKDITKCEATDSLTIFIGFSIDSHNMQNPSYWIINFETIEVAKSVLQRIQDSRNKIALEKRGLKGMYQGPNGISMFKKEVQGSLNGKIYEKSHNRMENDHGQSGSLPNQLTMYTYTEIQKQSAKNSENPQLISHNSRWHKTQSPNSAIIQTYNSRYTLNDKSIPLNGKNSFWLEKILVESSYLQTLGEFNKECKQIIMDLIDANQITHTGSITKQYGIDFKFLKDHTSQAEYLQLIGEFENYKYVLSKTNNEIQIKIPLLCLVRYKGWLCLAKLCIPGNIIKANYISDCIKQLVQVCQIDQQRWSAELTELDLSYFDSKQKKLSKCYFLTQLSKLLPTDSYLHSSNPHCISSECMNWLCESNSLKNSQQQNIHQNLKHNFFNLVEKLNKNEQQVYSYDELQCLFDKYYLTKEYLMPVYRKCKSKFTKQYLWTAIMAEQAYKLCSSFSSTLDIIKKLNEFSKMQGDLWEETRLQLQYKYQIVIARKDVKKCELVHLIIQMFGLFVDESAVSQRLSYINCLDVFNSQTTIFNAKVFDLRTYNSKLWRRIKLLISTEYTEEINSEVVQLLKLNDDPLQITNWPETHLFTKLRLCLALFTAPPEVKSKATPYSASLYRPTLSHKPSLWKWKLCISRIKWLLLENQIDRSTHLYEELVSNIKQWSNGQHPVLYELLTIMGRYHILIHEYGKAVKYLESGRDTYKRLFSQDVMELINISTQIAYAYEKGNEIHTALRNNLQVISSLEAIKLQNDQIYGMVQFNIGRQALHIQNFDMARQATLKSTAIFYNLNNIHDYQGKIVECYELLARIAELSDEQLYNSICENCSKGLGELKHPENIQQMVRIVLLRYLSKVLSEHERVMLAKLIEQIPKSTNSYVRAFSYIKKHIDQNTFVDLIDECMNNCERLCHEVEQEQLLKQWIGLEEQGTQKYLVYQFVCLIEALTNLVGEHYMKGALYIN